MPGPRNVQRKADPRRDDLEKSSSYTGVIVHG